MPASGPSSSAAPAAEFDAEKKIFLLSALAQVLSETSQTKPERPEEIHLGGWHRYAVNAAKLFTRFPGETVAVAFVVLKDGVHMAASSSGSDLRHELEHSGIPRVVLQRSKIEDMASTSVEAIVRSRSNMTIHWTPATSHTIAEDTRLPTFKSHVVASWAILRGLQAGVRGTFAPEYVLGSALPDIMHKYRSRLLVFEHFRRLCERTDIMAAFADIQPPKPGRPLLQSLTAVNTRLYLSDMPEPQRYGAYVVEPGGKLE